MIKHVHAYQENTGNSTDQKEKTKRNVLKNKCVRPLSAGITCALCLLLSMSVFYVSQVDSAYVSAGKKELPIYSVETGDNRIAISFDAAWGGDQTCKILDILDEFDVKTTFFLVDIWSEKYPELVKEIVARGHEIGNHSTTHAHMNALDRDGIARELKGMSDRAEKLTGVRPALFRPPYGEYNNLVVSTARAEGYQVIQWSVDSLDWKNKGVDDLVARSTKNVQGGDIVLFHNDSRYILQALPQILQNYQEQGLEVVKVSQLILQENYDIDHRGRQMPLHTNTPEVE